jgi:hypothetical protein
LLLAVLVVVAVPEEFLGVVIGVGAGLTAVQVWRGITFGGAGWAFSGYRDGALAESAYQAITRYTRRSNMVSGRLRYDGSTATVRAQIALRRRGDAGATGQVAEPQRATTGDDDAGDLHAPEAFGSLI